MNVGPELLGTHTINGRPVRFYCPPTAGPDFPWFSLDDLLLALKLSRQARRHIARLAREDWGEYLTTAMCEGSIITVAPHFVAQGLLDALISTGQITQSASDGYYEAGVSVMKELTGHLSPQDLLPWAAEALRRNDVGGPE